MSRCSGDLPDLDVFLCTDGVIGFSGEGYIVVSLDGVEERLPFRLTIVAESSGTGWTIRHFHGSVPTPDS